MDKRLDPIPFIDLASQRSRLGGSIDAAIGRVLDHGQYIHGPELRELEETLQTLAGTAHCITCANGTDALTLVMMAEGIGRGDAVIVPDFTFIATAEAVAQLGATPVFADVLPDTFNLDPLSLERAIAAAKDAGLIPRAVIPVDLFGLPADYAAVIPLAQQHDLVTIADAAQSFGASADGRCVGTFTDYTTTSFFPAKPLGCYGDGGAIFVEDHEKAELLRSLRVHGQSSDKYDNARIGLNSRLDTIQAAILLEKLRIFDDELKARERIAARYGGCLRERVTVPESAEGYRSVWAQYTVRLPRGVDRAALQERCRKDGVPTAVYYRIPLHMQTGYSAFPADPEGLPVSQGLSRDVLSLPMHPYLDAHTQDRIADAITNAVRVSS